MNWKTNSQAENLVTFQSEAYGEGVLEKMGVMNVKRLERS